MAVSSIRRVKANRQNSMKSTGPKDTSSTRYNAVIHGLLSEGITELDDPTSFLVLCERLENEFDPKGQLEEFLVRRVALCLVRLKRACLLEAEYVTENVNPPITEATGWDASMDELFSSPVNIIDPGIPARLPDAAVGVLNDRFQRYETSIEKKLFRTLNQLEQLQTKRRMSE